MGYGDIILDAFFIVEFLERETFYTHKPSGAAFATGVCLP
jgi:hypothetical protein